MGDSDERKQMVLAEGVKGDRARYDQLVVAAVIWEARGIELGRAEQLAVEGRDPPGGLAQALAS